MLITDFKITRFQYARDRVVGDSQVRSDVVNAATLELIDADGLSGLGFMQVLFQSIPAQTEIIRIFESEVWPGLKGEPPSGLIHRVTRARGGNQRAYSLPFEEAVQVALWDLAAKQAGLPLHKFLGGRKDRVRAYASGLDYHLGDDEFARLFARADALGYRAFKIKVGHPDFERDLNRLKILTETVRPGAQIMVDANEAWGAKEAAVKITAMRDAGYELLWIEDPILRDDFEGLRLLRESLPWTQINSGEYLSASDKRRLMLAGGCDMLNVHGRISEVMRIGWLAAEMGIPVTLGNTFLEVGVHLACALPEVEWMEYSFQNFEHLIEQPVEIRDGWAYAPQRPGHGLVLSETTRTEWACPEILPHDELVVPFNKSSVQSTANLAGDKAG